MYKSRKNFFLILGLLLVIFLIQFPQDSTDPIIYIMYNIIILVVYVVIVSLWKESIHKRVLHKMMIMHADGIIFFMNVWIISRTLRYTVFYQIEPFERWCWYMYYIPMVLIPMFCFMSARCLGEPEDWKPEKRFYVMYIPAFLMIIGVLTNDIHQFAFKLRESAEGTLEVYDRGFIYYCIIVWALVLSVAMMISLLKKCRVPGTKRLMWFPISAVMIGSIVALAYVANQTQGFIEFSVISYGVIITAWESCIWIGLIPSNTHYEKLFLESTVSAQIVDQNNKICYASENAIDLSEDIIERAKTEVIDLDGNVRLRCTPIAGGHVLWTEDISSVNEILLELEEIGQNLEERNDLLSAEIALKQRKVQIDEKNDLYDRIAKSEERQLNYIRNLLKEISPDDNILNVKLSIIGIIGVYIKRQTNLILLKEKSRKVSAEELFYCIRESVEWLRVCKIYCSLESNIAGEIDVNIAILLYDVFQRVVEKALYNVYSLLINLKEENGQLVLKMVLEEFRALLPSDYHEEQIKKYNGMLKIEELDGAEYVILRLPKGGEER